MIFTQPLKPAVIGRLAFYDNLLNRHKFPVIDPDQVITIFQVIDGNGKTVSGIFFPALKYSVHVVNGYIINSVKIRKFFRTGY